MHVFPAIYTITIKNLRVFTFLGVYDWEKQSRRIVILNIAITVEGDEPGKSDAIEDAVDYALIETRILQKMAQGNYNLIERLVTEVAVTILALDNRILRVSIEADKPGALLQADSVSVMQVFTRCT